MPAVKVRIGVAVSASGQWNAAGWTDSDGKPMDDADIRSTAFETLDSDPAEGELFYWLEAVLPLPEAAVTVHPIVIPEAPE